MLTPEYLQGLPAELEQLYLRLEEETIADICRRIAKVGHISDTAEYQILRMRELGAGTEYIKSKIKEYSGLSDDVVDQLFFDAAQVSDEFYKGAYAKAGKEYKPFEYNDFFQQIVVANVNQTKGELSNLTQSMGFSYRGSNGERRFRPVATAYRECLDYAFTQVETGTTDYITAIRNATRRLTESGLQFVDYESGVVNHVDVAVRRAVLTGISQVTGKISEHNAAELETDIVEVTAHAGARPDHAEWQGGWYSLSGKSKKYRSLAEATGYGRVDGLKGANCRHDFFPVIEGIDTPLYTKEELANIDPPPFEYNGKRYTYYEATQKQRSMERAIRKTKREILAADKSGDKDRFTEKSIRLRRQREEYDKFSKSAGLLTQNERNQVVGFGRSEASRASWVARSAQTSGNGPKGTPTSGSSGSGLTNANGNGIIKENFLNQMLDNVPKPYSVTPVKSYIKLGSALFSDDNYSAMLKKEYLISKNDFETAIIFNPNGSYRSEKKGKSDEVSFSVSERRAMHGCVLTHNHPNSSVQSPQDINMLRTAKLSEIRACNKNGAYVITRPEKWSREIGTLEKLSEKYYDCYENAMSKYRDISAQEGIPFGCYLKVAETEGVRDFCKKYGFGFRWEGRNDGT